MTRVLNTGDWHGGHKFGAACHDECDNDIQRRGMKMVDEAIIALRPIDLMVMNGDGIEGNAPRNGGIELITPDRIEQAKMMIRYKQHLDLLNGKPMTFYATYGTPYHSGNAENYEQIIADAFPLESGKSNITENLVLDVEGYKLHYRHHIPSGSILTRGSNITKQAIIRILKETQGYAHVNFLGRSHVHYAHRNPDYLGKTLQIIPALQMWSGYGARQCDGITSFGVVAMDIHQGKVVHWHDYYTNKPIVKEQVLRYSDELSH